MPRTLSLREPEIDIFTNLSPWLDWEPFNSIIFFLSRLNNKLSQAFLGTA